LCVSRTYFNRSQLNLRKPCKLLHIDQMDEPLIIAEVTDECARPKALRPGIKSPDHVEPAGWHRPRGFAEEVSRVLPPGKIDAPKSKLEHARYLEHRARTFP
jgi:hypothetical protein